MCSFLGGSSILVGRGNSDSLFIIISFLSFKVVSAVVEILSLLKKMLTYNSFKASIPMIPLWSESSPSATNTSKCPFAYL